MAVLAVMPLVAKRAGRKLLLTIGLAAYVVRFAIFAYVPKPWAVIPALTMHGLCFGCFFFIAFLVVDELTTKDVRASAQGLFNLVVIGFGVIVGNLFAGKIAQLSAISPTQTDYRRLFSVPMWVSVGCLLVL